jgi:hypothetical protein
MDTIGLTLKTCTGDDFEKIIQLINGTNELNNCTLLREVNNTLSLEVKLSYPKYFNYSNAYLITSPGECLKVNQDFINKIRKLDLDAEIEINLTRVDIPFTYTMEPSEEFHHYDNIFFYMSKIYHMMNSKSDPKYISEVLTKNQETYIMGNSRNAKSSSSKITIYDQSKRFEDCYGGYKLNQAYSYHDFGSRIRIEPSKRIKRKSFSMAGFENFDIYSEYYWTFKNYLLLNILNYEKLQLIQESEVEELTILLQAAKEESNFTYEAFIYKHINLIKDYQVLRKALENNLGKGIYLEKILTKVRKIIKKIEEENQIIIFDTSKKIQKMASSL